MFSINETSCFSGGKPHVCTYLSGSDSHCASDDGYLAFLPLCRGWRIPLGAPLMEVLRYYELQEQTHRRATTSQQHTDGHSHSSRMLLSHHILPCQHFESPSEHNCRPQPQGRAISRTQLLPNLTS